MVEEHKPQQDPGAPRSDRETPVRAPDPIRMTGEEDPLAAVDHGDFDAVVGDLAASERRRKDPATEG